MSSETTRPAPDHCANAINAPYWARRAFEAEGYAEAVLAVLKSIQWGSCDGCGQMRQCPECGASRFGPDEDERGMQLPGKHAETCSVGRMVALVD
jgi:hypothetical protein